MSDPRPFISLCMIVKNEAANLPRCLASARPVVDEIIVVDTGSLDETVAIAESFGARVVHFPWINDFSAARNAGLAVALGEWVLVLDADEELHGDDRHRLREICQAPDVEAYSMLHVNLLDAGNATDSENSYDVTLWRHRPEYRYRGKLHEQIVTAIHDLRPQAKVEYCHTIRVLHYGYMAEAVRSHGKVERNLKLARQLVADHPDDAFHRFNLALELQRAGDLPGAVAEFDQARSLLAHLGFWPLWCAKLFKSYASCLAVMRRFTEGEAVVRHGLTVYPGFTDLVYLLGYMAQEQGRHPEAVGHFHRAIAMGPAKEAGGWPGLAGFRAWEAMAKSYDALGRVKEAVEAWAEVYAAQPDYALALAGMVESLSGHLPDGHLLAHMQTYIDPGSPPGQIRLADVLLAGRRPDLTLTVLGETLPLEDPTAAFLQGKALLALERYPEAAGVLERFPPASGTPGASALLAAHAASGGRNAVMAVVRRCSLTGADLTGAARLLLKDARACERTAGH